LALGYRRRTCPRGRLLADAAHSTVQRYHVAVVGFLRRGGERAERGHVAGVVVGVDQVRIDGERRLDVPVPHELRDVDRPDARREAQARPGRAAPQWAATQ
jgi:hypothetical protein